MSRQIRAEALHLAGRLAFAVGRALHDVSLRLCGVGGTLDAMADNAGYWDRHAPRIAAQAARAERERIAGALRERNTCEVLNGPTLHAMHDAADFIERLASPPTDGGTA